MMARKSKIDEDYEELSVAADPWKTGDVHGKVGDVHDIRTFAMKDGNLACRAKHA